MREHVVAEDVGAEDGSQAGLLVGHSGCLVVRYETNGRNFVLWPRRCMDNVSANAPYGQRPIEARPTPYPGIKHNRVEFWEGLVQATG